MNLDAQNELNRIKSLQFHEITPTEAAFLRARRSYLSPVEQEVYSEFLKQSEIKKVRDTRAVKAKSTKK